MELHETRMGRKLLEADLPRAIRALEQIAEALEKLNKPRTYKYNLKKNLIINLSDILKNY